MGVTGSFALLIAIDALIVSEGSELEADGTRSPGSTACQPQPSLPSTLAASGTFASPHKRGGMSIPAPGRLLEEFHDLLWRLGMLSSQGAGFEQMLDRLGHVEPAAAKWGADRQNPLAKEPAEELGVGMPHNVIPDQQHAQRWQILDQGDFAGQSLAPTFPPGPILLWTQNLGGFWQRGEDLTHLIFEPGMDDGIGGLAHPLGAYLPGCRTEQRQEFGDPVALKMGINPPGLSLHLPARGWIGNGVVGTGLILTTHRQAEPLSDQVGPLNQIFFWPWYLDR
jgi:hypothetical protein